MATVNITVTPVTKELELGIRPRAATIKNGLVRLRLRGADGLQMGVNDAIHGSVELFAGFHATIVEPAVSRFAALTVRRFPTPGHVAPKNGLVKTRGLEHRPCVDAIVEKQHERGAPVMSDRERLAPIRRCVNRAVHTEMMAGCRGRIKSGTPPLALAGGRKDFVIVVGTAVASRPPHRSVGEELPHTDLASRRALTASAPMCDGEVPTHPCCSRTEMPVGCPAM